jgi:hypothetical protein
MGGKLAAEKTFKLWGAAALQRYVVSVPRVTLRISRARAIAFFERSI